MQRASHCGHGYLEAELAASFEQHPDADIYRSLPGLGVVLGARVLGEFGDHPERYESAKSRRNYAGTSPLTVASGRKHTVKARFIRNRRLYDAADQWALCSLRASPGVVTSTTAAAPPATSTLEASGPTSSTLIRFRGKPETRTGSPAHVRGRVC